MAELQRNHRRRCSPEKLANNLKNHVRTVFGPAAELGPRLVRVLIYAFPVEHSSWSLSWSIFDF